MPLPNESTWTVRDDAGLAPLVAEGMSTAEHGWWGDEFAIGDRVRALNGFTLEVARVMALHKTKVIASEGVQPVAHVKLEMDGDADLAAAVANINRGLWLLAECDARADGASEAQARGAIQAPRSVLTVEAPKPDTTGFPVGIGVAVVVASVQFAAVAYIAERAAQIVDRQLARNAKLRVMVQEQAHTVALVGQHLDAEAVAKRPLPLSDATKLALSKSAARQDTIADALAKETPLPSLIPTKELTAPLLTAAAVAAAVYLLA